MTKTFPISLDLNRKYNIKLQITEHCPGNHFLFSDLPRAVLRFIDLETGTQWSIVVFLFEKASNTFLHRSHKGRAGPCRVYLL